MHKDVNESLTRKQILNHTFKLKLKLDPLNYDISPNLTFNDIRIDDNRVRVHGTLMKSYETNVKDLSKYGDYFKYITKRYQAPVSRTGVGMHLRRSFRGTRLMEDFINGIAVKLPDFRYIKELKKTTKDPDEYASSICPVVHDAINLVSSMLNDDITSKNVKTFYSFVHTDKFEKQSKKYTKVYDDLSTSSTLVDNRDRAVYIYCILEHIVENLKDNSVYELPSFENFIVKENEFSFYKEDSEKTYYLNRSPDDSSFHALPDIPFIVGTTPNAINLKYISLYFNKDSIVVDNYSKTPLTETLALMELLKKKDLKKLYASFYISDYIDANYYRTFYKEYTNLKYNTQKEFLKIDKDTSELDVNLMELNQTNKITPFLYVPRAMQTLNINTLMHKDLLNLSPDVQMHKYMGSNYDSYAWTPKTIKDNIYSNKDGSAPRLNEKIYEMRLKGVVFTFLYFLYLHKELNEKMDTPFFDNYFRTRLDDKILKDIYRDYKKGLLNPIFKHKTDEELYINFQKYLNKIKSKYPADMDNPNTDIFTLDYVFGGIFNSILMSSRIAYVKPIYSLLVLLHYTSDIKKEADSNDIDMSGLLEAMLDNMDEIPDEPFDMGIGKKFNRDFIEKEIDEAVKDVKDKNKEKKDEFKLDVNLEKEKTDSKYDIDLSYATKINRKHEKDQKFVKNYENGISKIDKIIKSLTEELKKIKVYNETKKIGGQSKGKIDIKNIHKYRTDPKIFMERKYKQLESDLAIGVLLDVSGSMMSGTKMEDGKLTTILLHETLNSMNINHGIYTHTSSAYHQSEIKCYRAFKEDTSNYVKTKAYGLLEINALSGNCDAAAVQYVSKQLNNTRNRDKILIVFSDGEPTECDSDELITEIKHASETSKVIGIGIQMPNIKKYYPDYANGKNLMDLVKIISQIIKDYILDKNLH